MLVAGLFLPPFYFNKNSVQALPQCHDGVDNELPLGDGFTDFFGVGVPDPQCTCYVDDDENALVAAGKKYYIAYDRGIVGSPNVWITFSCGMGGYSPELCSSFDGDIDPVNCPTGWICTATDTSASCYVGFEATQANACIAYDTTANPLLAVCETPYEACGCTCCVPIGSACGVPPNCCSGNCDPVTGNCIAAFVCVTAGNGPCAVDADCCGGLVCNTLGICVAAPPPLCTANGDPCTKNIECCSGICDIMSGLNECIATSSGMPVCTTGGLIPCGRNCDVAGTPWLEDDPCTLCHLILMGQLIIEFLVKMAAIFAILALVAGGLVYVFSIGSAGTIEKAKTIIKYALLGFTVVFIAWAVIGTILTAMGYMDPLGGEWHMMDC